jgi:hypothetical protein
MPSWSPSFDHTDTYIWFIESCFKLVSRSFYSRQLHPLPSLNQALCDSFLTFALRTIHKSFRRLHPFLGYSIKILLLLLRPSGGRARYLPSQVLELPRPSDAQGLGKDILGWRSRRDGDGLSGFCVYSREKKSRYYANPVSSPVHFRRSTAISPTVY